MNDVSFLRRGQEVCRFALRSFHESPHSNAASEGDKEHTVSPLPPVGFQMPPDLFFCIKLNSHCCQSHSLSSVVMMCYSVDPTLCDADSVGSKQQQLQYSVPLPLFVRDSLD